MVELKKYIGDVFIAGSILGVFYAVGVLCFATVLWSTNQIVPFTDAIAFSAVFGPILWLLFYWAISYS